MGWLKLIGILIVLYILFKVFFGLWIVGITILISFLFIAALFWGIVLLFKK